METVDLSVTAGGEGLSACGETGFSFEATGFGLGDSGFGGFSGGALRDIGRDTIDFEDGNGFGDSLGFGESGDLGFRGESGLGDSLGSGSSFGFGDTLMVGLDGIVTHLSGIVAMWAGW